MRADSPSKSGFGMLFWNSMSLETEIWEGFCRGNHFKFEILSHGVVSGWDFKQFCKRITDRAELSCSISVSHWSGILVYSRRRVWEVHCPDRHPHPWGQDILASEKDTEIYRLKGTCSCLRYGNGMTASGNISTSHSLQNTEKIRDSKVLSWLQSLFRNRDAWREISGMISKTQVEDSREVDRWRSICTPRQLTDLWLTKTLSSYCSVTKTLSDHSLAYTASSKVRVPVFATFSLRFNFPWAC